MSLAADRVRAEQFKDLKEARKKRDANALMGSLSPYLQEVSLDVSSPDFANIDETNFNKMMFGKEKVEDQIAEYENLESYGAGGNFVKPKEHDLMVDVVNSLSTARSYTDIGTGKTREGEVVGIRINKTNGAIHYDLKTDQGIVPKTLGFSNDPKDIVMSSDLAGFRTLFNTAVRKINADSSAESLRRQGSTLLAGNLKYDKNVLGEEGPVEYSNELDNKVARGEMVPSAAFVEMGQINSTIQDEIDEFNLNARTKTEAAATEFDRQAGTIDEAQAREIIKNGQFFDQSGNIQRQILKLLPGNEIGLRTGVNKELQDQLRNSSGEQKIEKRTGPEGPTTGLFGQPVESEKPETTTVLTDAQPDTITQGGVEYKRADAAPEVFKGTDLVFPTGDIKDENYRSRVNQFLTDNQAELLRIGVEDKFLKDAQVLFNKYDIQNPEDLRKIPIRDPEIEFGRKEAAVAYAVAAGDPDNFNENFEFAFNIMNTDDPNQSVLDRLDRATTLEQSRNTYVESVNRLMSESMRNNRKAEADATEDLLNLGEEINYFKDFDNNNRKTIQDPTIGANLNKFQKLLQTVKLKGGVAGTSIKFDPNTGLVDAGSISPGSKTVLRQQIGEFVSAFAITKGDQQRGGVFGFGIIGGNRNLNAVAGDISTNMRIRTETVNGREQIKEIVTLDPNGGQYVPVMTGDQFRSYFPDAESSGLVMSVIDRE